MVLYKQKVSASRFPISWEAVCRTMRYCSLLRSPPCESFPWCRELFLMISVWQLWLLASGEQFCLVCNYFINKHIFVTFLWDHSARMAQWWSNRLLSCVSWLYYIIYIYPEQIFVWPTGSCSGSGCLHNLIRNTFSMFLTLVIRYWEKKVVNTALTMIHLLSVSITVNKNTLK